MVYQGQAKSRPGPWVGSQGLTQVVGHRGNQVSSREDRLGANRTLVASRGCVWWQLTGPLIEALFVEHIWMEG